MSEYRALRDALRQEIASYPVVDCHEHTTGPQAATENREPITCLMAGYIQSDLMSAIPPGWKDGPQVMGTLNDQSVSTEAKWPLFESLWRQTEHTAYARVTKRVLRDVYGEAELTLEALLRIRPRLLNLRDPGVYRQVLDEAHVACRITDLYALDLRAYLQGKAPVYERDRLMISLPRFHGVRAWQHVYNVTGALGQTVTSLEGYLAAYNAIFTQMKALGAVGMKDQSAYDRTLNYGNPSRAEAEPLFNRMMANPRSPLGWPEAKPLDDYLFQRCLEMAAALDLPVQIHTGHMAGIRNEIAKTNAVLLTPLLEMHQGVRFDLFHGNWPYMGEYLFLGKNYPNVHLDLCWLHIIDPIYARNLLSEGLTAVPHSKFHAYGGDYGDDILHAVAHLAIAKDVVSEALAERVEAGWISEAEALRIAADWLYNNPNEYFCLGLDPFRP